MRFLKSSVIITALFVFLQTKLQLHSPFQSGVGLGANMEYTQNRQASTSTIFINPVLTGVTALGDQKVQLGVGPRINVAAPDGNTNSWGWWAVMVLLFPK